MLELGQRVTIWSPVRRRFLNGYVTRLWDRPAGDPYVTVVVDGCRTYVRSMSVVYPLDADELNAVNAKWLETSDWAAPLIKACRNCNAILITSDPDLCEQCDMHGSAKG